MSAPDRQELLDAFYFAHGPCCAGCDWWRSHNSMAGDCTKRAPVRDRTRFAMLNIHGSSLKPDAGHIVTPRNHVCGDFKDEFDWASLPPHYLRRIGAPSEKRTKQPNENSQ